MKLVVGLGNPGPEYEETKHNVGFWVIDLFCKKYKIPLSGKTGKSIIGRWTGSPPRPPLPNDDLILAKPTTFMNRSGEAVRALLKKFQLSLSDLIVVQDDMDMDCGRVRIRTEGRAGGHRGIASIIEQAGSNQFIRLKIGIGRDPNQDPSDYVLTPFSKEDKGQVLIGVQRGVEILPLLLSGKIPEAMNRAHIR